AGTTIDINSVFGNGEGGNFGIQLTNNVWSYTGTDEYYSTASCGQQIEPTYRSNQLDRYNICDIYNLEQWVWVDGEGRYNLKVPSAEVTSAYINEQLKAKNMAVIGQVAAQMLQGPEPAKRAADAVLASEMDKNLAARVLVNHSLAIDDAQLATSLLASPQLNGIDADLRTILATDIAILSKLKLTAGQVSILSGIDNKNNAFSAIARDVIQSYEGEHDYKFKKQPAPEPKPGTNPMVRANSGLNVYPVPSYDKITVKHFVNHANVLGVKIVSSIGAEVANFTYTLQAGEVSIDISSLAAGVYTVILVTDSEEKAPMNGRFIKLH
ncbi:MAG TPA: T9SS type A sorting domain-containing protein, partial [Bacteroidia bacterium]|nr:T9SS type A sorting domain-containing protein [Bacteroidia bacterium]